MSVTNRTNGELLFEQYLYSQNLRFEFEKAFPEKNNRPDYTVSLNREYLFDVKDFEQTEIPDFGTYDPYKRIRQRIDDARTKFKEFENWPCCVVFYNNGASLVNLETPRIMLGSMEGNAGISLDFNPETGHPDPATTRNAFLDQGKMIRPHWNAPQNTKISALITLRFIRIDMHEKPLGVIVWENRFANIPFPRELFCGKYDERYGFEGNKFKRVFAGTGIPEIEDSGFL